MSINLFPVLFGIAALAGWIDAVVGGGGFVQLPALLIAGPSLPVPSILGTNKLAATVGTLSAAVTYARKHPIDRAVAIRGGVTAVIGSGCGALLALVVSSAFLRPFILILLVGVAVFVLVHRKFGTSGQVREAKGTGGSAQLVKQRRRAAALVLVAGGGIGLYDGLVGPGTGTFLIISFTTLLGLDFISALSTVKVIHVGTNLGALLVFASQGHVLWGLGIGMSLFNVVGAFIGARMTLSRGSKFVRVVLLVVIACLVARLSADQFGWTIG